MYGESLEGAVRRKAKEEAGIDVKIIRRVGVYSTVFTKKSGQKRHTVNVVYLVKMVGGRLKCNSEYSKFLFAKRMDKKLPSYTAAIIRESGVFGKVQGKPTRSKDYFVI
ncbi:TPA: NUDIX hydrolase, partial [Candidatus Micrarchaeota archaeon]|nr:NUDIX hydrolase [Candidatus Micrarchaeota archaeon]HII09685.1 NUDIX hydrolase [Candidatus Micrarchaeota archaeon]